MFRNSCKRKRQAPPQHNVTHAGPLQTRTAAAENMMMGKAATQALAPSSPSQPKQMAASQILEHYGQPHLPSVPAGWLSKPAAAGLPREDAHLASRWAGRKRRGSRTYLQAAPLMPEKDSPAVQDSVTPTVAETCIKGVVCCSSCGRAVGRGQGWVQCQRCFEAEHQGDGSSFTSLPISCAAPLDSRVSGASRPGAWVPGDSREELSSAEQQPAVTARSSGSQAALHTRRAEAPWAEGRAATIVPAEDMSASDISSLSKDGQEGREALCGKLGSGSDDAARAAEVQHAEASSRRGPMQAVAEPPAEQQGGDSHPVHSEYTTQQGTGSRDRIQAGKLQAVGKVAGGSRVQESKAVMQEEYLDRWPSGFQVLSECWQVRPGKCTPPEVSASPANFKKQELIGILCDWGMLSEGQPLLFKQKGQVTAIGMVSKGGIRCMRCSKLVSMRDFAVCCAGDPHPRQTMFEHNTWTTTGDNLSDLLKQVQQRQSDQALSHAAKPGGTYQATTCPRGNLQHPGSSMYFGNVSKARGAYRLRPSNVPIAAQMGPKNASGVPLAEQQGTRLLGTSLARVDRGSSSAIQPGPGQVQRAPSILPIQLSGSVQTQQLLPCDTVQPGSRVAPKSMASAAIARKKVTDQLLHAGNQILQQVRLQVRQQPSPQRQCDHQMPAQRVVQGAGILQQPLAGGAGVPRIPPQAQTQFTAVGSCVIGYPVQSHGGQPYVIGKPVSSSTPYIRHGEDWGNPGPRMQHVGLQGIQDVGSSVQQDGPLRVGQQLMRGSSVPQQPNQGAWSLIEQQQLTLGQQPMLRQYADNPQQWQGPDTRSSNQPATGGRAQQASLQACTDAANVPAMHTQWSGSVQRPGGGNAVPYQPLTSLRQQVVQPQQSFATSATPAPRPALVDPTVQSGRATQNPVPQGARLLPPNCRCQKCQEQRRLAPPGCRCLQCLQWLQAGQQLGLPPISSSQVQQRATGQLVSVQLLASQAQHRAAWPSSVPLLSSQGPQTSSSQPIQAGQKLGQGPSKQQNGNSIPLPGGDGSQHPSSQAQQASFPVQSRQPAAAHIDASADGQVQNSMEGLALLEEVMEADISPQLERKEHHALQSSEEGASPQVQADGQPAADTPLAQGRAPQHDGESASGSSAKERSPGMLPRRKPRVATRCKLQVNSEAVQGIDLDSKPGAPVDDNERQDNLSSGGKVTPKDNMVTLQVSKEAEAPHQAKATVGQCTPDDMGKQPRAPRVRERCGGLNLLPHQSHSRKAGKGRNSQVEDEGWDGSARITLVSAPQPLADCTWEPF